MKGKKQKFDCCLGSKLHGKEFTTGWVKEAGIPRRVGEEKRDLGGVLGRRSHHTIDRVPIGPFDIGQQHKSRNMG
jgi:hypothetical protein